MKKYIVGALIILVIISAYSIFRFVMHSDKGEIYNSDKIIFQESDSFTYVNRQGETDENGLDIKFDNFSGSDSIWTFDFKEQTQLKFKYSSEVSKGRFKGVLVSPEKKVNIIFENSGEGEQTFGGQAGKYIFKLVGDNTSGKVNVELAANQDNVITNIRH